MTEICSWKGVAEDFKHEFGMYGFVYIIKNNDNGQLYIGSKQFMSKKAGKYTESNWRDYQSSNKKVAGWTNITKTILKICYCKFELSYTEVEYIIKSKALCSNKYENYYLGSQTIGRCPNYMRVDLS